MIEAESRRAAETAQARVGEVEEALRAKEKELEAALVRAGDADRKQLSLVAVVEELTEQIANAKAKMDEKTREIADLKAFVPGPERQSEFNDALAALEAKERDLLESKGRIKVLESQLAAANPPRRASSGKIWCPGSGSTRTKRASPPRVAPKNSQPRMPSSSW